MYFSETSLGDSEEQPVVRTAVARLNYSMLYATFTFSAFPFLVHLVNSSPFRSCTFSVSSKVQALTSGNVLGMWQDLWLWFI